MRRAPLLLTAVAILSLATVPAALAQTDRNCADFLYQEDAQAYFDANGGSRHKNVDNLDTNRDGITCDSLPHFVAGAATKRALGDGSDADGAVKGGLGAAKPLPGGLPYDPIDPDAVTPVVPAEPDPLPVEPAVPDDRPLPGLPFTGYRDTLLPAGMALLFAGLALLAVIGMTRTRPRHVRR